jgi:hypothetical protein
MESIPFISSHYTLDFISRPIPSYTGLHPIHVSLSFSDNSESPEPVMLFLLLLLFLLPLQSE